MKNWRTIIFVLLAVILVWFLKFVINFSSADIDIITLTLTVVSILFGLLASFFIAQLWSRYTEIRSLQGDRMSAGLILISCAKYFFNNKEFEKDFKKRMEKAVIADQIINIDEGTFEEPYYLQVEESFKHLKINNSKEEQYLQSMLGQYGTYVNSTIRMDILYHERMFFSEWFILSFLSVLIFISILFLNPLTFFYKVIIFTFPPLIVLTLSLLYDLDKMNWSREIVTIEPSERILDAIETKRFYMKKDVKDIHHYSKGYRTEDSLEGDLKEVYKNILKLRNMKKTLTEIKKKKI